MEKLTYKNVRTKVAGKPTGSKSQKSVASELIFALSKPKIKKEIKEEQSDEFQETVSKKIDLKDFQATIAKNLNVENIKAVNTVKLSNKTKTSAKRTPTKVAVEPNNESSLEDKTALKTKVNNDWINFLKKRNDTEPLVEDNVVEVEESPNNKPQQQPRRKRNIKKEVFSTELPSPKPVNTPSKVKSKSQDFKVVNAKKEVEKDVEKDLILNNLMNQVAELESSMGANISKLESNLREEKVKSKKLEDDLESEKENYSDIATKLIAIQQNKLTTEEIHLKKLNEIDEKLKSEKSKYSGLAKEFSKLEKALKDEKKSKEKISKDLISVASEKEKLKLNVENLMNWKEESVTKIKASIMNCQEEHVQKIQELEETDELKSDMIVEISTRMSMIISEYSSNFNLKNKEIESLEGKLDEKDDLLKEKDKKVKEMEIKMKEKESRCREKEENEDKYKEKLDRYREKEDRYREKEDKFKEKDKKFREREDKCVDLEKRLKEKERKFKENDDKLRQKEDEMFRVYELVNQLQLRMKNDKINPIVNGQDILSIGKSKSKNSTEVKDEDEDVCILPTPVKVPEKASALTKPNVESMNEVKELEKLEGAVDLSSDSRPERKVNNDPRQKKDRVIESIDISKAEEFGVRKSPKQATNDIQSKEPTHKTSSANSSKSTLVKASDLKRPSDTSRSSEERKTFISYSKLKEHRSFINSQTEERKYESSNRSSRSSSGNGRRAEHSEKVPNQSPKASARSSKSPEGNISHFKSSETLIQKSSPLNKSIQNKEVPKPVELVQKQSKELNSVVSPFVSDQAALAKTLPEVTSETFISSKVTEVQPLLHGFKRKPEIEPEIKPAKKTNIPTVMEEEEILLLDDEDDIQCVMEIKAAPELAYATKKDNVEKESIKDAVKNLLTEEKSKAGSLVEKRTLLNIVEDDDIQLEFDLPEPVPCVEKRELDPACTNSKTFEKGLPLVNLNSNSRMKASDFFKEVNIDNSPEVKELEKIAKSYDEGLELENWISMQLRLERQRIESGETKDTLDDSIDSISDSSQETLKKMFLLDLELQEVDQNENRTASKPFYVNPEITWVLQKWPNLPERLVSQLESPKPKDSECKIIHETEVQDPRLRRKYGLDASGLNMSYQQQVAMKKIVKSDEKFFIPRSSRNLMLPYLWPMVKYVKKDLMKFFDESPVKKVQVTNELGSLSKSSPEQEIIELDYKQDEVTIGLLYDDLEICVPEGLDTYNSETFGMKRTWDEMKTCDLALERSRIIDELKNELNKSTNSNISSLDESNSDLLISFEEQDEDENCAKKFKPTCFIEENKEVFHIVQDLIEECIQSVGTEIGNEVNLGDFNINSVALEGDELEIIESEATEWTDDSFEYKCSFLPADLTEEIDNSFENVETEPADDNCDVVSDVKKTSLKSEKSARKRPVKRRSLTRGTVGRYLGSKRCFGRSLC